MSISETSSIHVDIIMKIDSTLKPTASGLPAATPKPAAPAAPAATSVEVRLSEAARLASAGEKPPVDTARIAEIKLAISEGRFKINADAIADGLIATSRELIESQRRG